MYLRTSVMSVSQIWGTSRRSLRTPLSHDMQAGLFDGMIPLCLHPDGSRTMDGRAGLVVMEARSEMASPLERAWPGSPAKLQFIRPISAGMAFSRVAGRDDLEMHQRFTQ